MTDQKNGKESVQDFVKRSQTDALTAIADLNKHVVTALQYGDHGLSVSDLGSKISKEEGKLDILSKVAYLIDNSRT